MMIVRFLFGGFLSVMLYAFLLPGITGCANIVPPSGGPRDSLPPRLIAAVPGDSALMVKEQKLVLYFDEFIELKNAAEQVLISPYPEKSPQFEARLKTLTVRLKDSLLPSTTYIIDFGQAIVDINEGNVLKNFRYVFSTGNQLDTLQFSGKIIPAETGKADSTLIALLYRAEEDSSVCKKLPAYITRLDGQGNFRFVNLPEGNYYIYGLQDTDGNKKYTPPYEQFAFSDTPVFVSSTSSPVQLWAYKQEKDKKRNATTATKKLPFTTNIESGAHNYFDTLYLQYVESLSNIDQKKIHLKEDSTASDEIFKLVFNADSSIVGIAAGWKKGGAYKLFFDTAYAKDVKGFRPTLKDTFSFRVRSDKEYGSLRIKLKNLDLSKNPVLLFYIGEKIAYSYPLANADFFQPVFTQGSYRIGILYDDNGNSKWDPGNYFTQPRKQPERVRSFEKIITVKPEWDNEVQVDLKEE
jgi:hypothetical protein